MTTKTSWPVYHRISGPIIMIGFGSIGRGTLPLIERHFDFDKSRMVIIDPSDAGKALADKHGVRFLQREITSENYKDVLTPLLTEGEGQGFCVNLSVDVGSVDVMRLCREIDVPYIDTVVEPWFGFYVDQDNDPAERTNYVLRETARTEKRNNPGGTTAVSCCGANPGMVSFFVKQALINLATDLGLDFDEPAAEDRDGWARLMQRTGTKGIHIAERDTQRAKSPKPLGTFVNTWSVDGFISEGQQPAELGWGTHEKWMPDNAHHQKDGTGCQSAIYMTQPGGATKVRTWCPTPGAQHGFLVTHNESVSIADFFTIGEGTSPEYRPTVHYAYHPADDAVVSLHELFGNEGKPQAIYHILDEHEIVDGIDELGVLLYGHAKNAYWYGSQLSIEETRELAPYQNATGLQVTSAVIAGMVWAIENPNAGIVEADELDYKRCLEVQLPYLGPVKGYYTDWTPLEGRPSFFAEDLDESDPWQFKNVLVRP
ncbi:homospermidine synthase [Pyruvatibacter sp.]|uniref:homospermidine synthase n=1 Tax=Pyruvatibacter sp. TaxID=1981328 RepID=UPI003263CDED